ncbi:hypothetical protein OQA88_5572 [Cercophora sp. LCS_1]
MIQDAQTERQGPKKLTSLKMGRTLFQGLTQLERYLPTSDEQNIGVRKLSAAIWGPCCCIFNLSTEFPEAVDIIFDAGQKLGQRIPDIYLPEPLIVYIPNALKVVASMYRDLLQFFKILLGYWGTVLREFDVNLKLAEQQSRIVTRILEQTEISKWMFNDQPKHKALWMSGKVGSNDALTEELLGAFCHATNLFIVIDGLENAGDHAERIIKFWLRMVQESERNNTGELRFLFISQDVPIIRRIAQDRCSPVAELSVVQPAEEVEKYIRCKVAGLRDKFKLSDEEADVVRRKVSAASHGLFGYAVETLKNVIPGTIRWSYQMIWQTIMHSPSFPAASRIFRLPAGTQRPLKLFEVQAALSVKAQDSHIRMNYHRYQFSDDIRYICSAFITVSDQAVDFSHPSAKKYLTMDCFKPDLPDDSVKSSVESGLYALQDYAVAHWANHLQDFIQTAAPLFSAPQLSTYEKQTMTAISNFLEFYQVSTEKALPTLLLPAKKATNVPPQRGTTSQPKGKPSSPTSDCEGFSKRLFHLNLLKLWSHVCKTGPLLDLEDVVQRSRNKMVELHAGYPGGPRKDNLERFYGPRYYKCSRIDCTNFYEGFATEEEAAGHSREHNHRRYGVTISSRHGWIHAANSKAT